MYTNLPAVNYLNLPDINLKIPIWVQGLQYWYKWQIKSIYYCTINVPSLYDSFICENVKSESITGEK